MEVLVGAGARQVLFEQERAFDQENPGPEELGCRLENLGAAVSAVGKDRESLPPRDLGPAGAERGDLGSGELGELVHQFLPNLREEIGDGRYVVAPGQKPNLQIVSDTNGLADDRGMDLEAVADVLQPFAGGDPSLQIARAL